LEPSEECPYPEKSIIIEAKSDIRREPPHPGTQIRLSAATGEGINELVELLVAKSRSLLPHEGEVAINRRHRDVLQEALSHLHEARQAYDPLLASEALRLARASLDRVTGRAGVEEMLDSLFGRFCIGK
jgi:tRNA modification GTPase